MNVTTQMLRKTVLGMIVAAGVVGPQSMNSTQATDLMEDPATGDTYQVITRPVVEERMETREYNFTRPQTVAETRPELRTTWIPVTQMKWMPYVENRFNIFRPATVAYRQIPETRWEARSEVVNRTTYGTTFVQERRKETIPHRITRYQTDYKLVAKGRPAGQNGLSIPTAVAQRLRPVTPTNSFSSAPAMVASNAIGRTTSDPPRRSSMQSGFRTNVLSPTGTATTVSPPSFHR